MPVSASDAKDIRANVCFAIDSSSAPSHSNIVIFCSLVLKRPPRQVSRAHCTVTNSSAMAFFMAPASAARLSIALLAAQRLDQGVELAFDHTDGAGACLQ